MSHKICVLFVDDEFDLCENLALAFELEDFKTLTTNSGESAIEVLKQNPDINFIISDVRMANGDGLFLLNHLRNNPHNKIPIVMLSGFTETSESKFIDLGALALLQKPIKVDILIEFVRSHLSNS